MELEQQTLVQLCLWEFNSTPIVNKRRKWRCVTGLQGLPVCDCVSKNRTGVWTSHDSSFWAREPLTHCVWLSAHCAYVARVPPQYWEAAADDIEVTNC